MRNIIFFCSFVLSPLPSFGQLIYQYEQKIPVVEMENDTLTMPWAGGLNSPQYNTMDLDGDGDEDLVIFERSSNRFKTFENKNQQYYYNPAFEYLFPEDLESWVLLKDYNCDGKKDIFTNTIFGIRVLKNVGDDLPAWEEVANPIYTLGISGSDINLQVNGSDIPGIADIDNDGDLDILVYNFSIGGFIRYHKNLSIETQGNCDTLRFQRVDSNWGNFEECECDYFAFGTKTCEEVVKGRTMHAGGKSMLFIETDADNDKDLLMSQEDCNKLYFLENKGSAENALMTEFSMQYPIDKPAHLHFPAAYYEDVTFDGIPDLLVAPNLDASLNRNENFSESSWLYENVGSATNVNFKFRTNQFLQQEMIDAGENAQAAFIDIDNDQDLDMLIAGNYIYQENQYYGGIKLYENVGDARAPSFQLVENNYLDFASRNLVDLQLSIVNINESTLPEIMVHGSKPFSFDTYSFYITNFSRVTEFAVPTQPGDNAIFYDVDGDGLVDLLAGKVTGNIQYFKNNGSNQNPSFTLEENNFANIEENFLRREVFPAIADIDNSGDADLVTIDNSGIITVYRDLFSSSSIVADSINIYLSEVENSVFPRLGKSNSISIVNLSQQKFPSLAIGTRDGGLLFLKNRSPQNIEPIIFNIYPNPPVNQNYVNISSSRDGFVDVVSMMGNFIYKDVSIKAEEDLQLSTTLLAEGLYIVRMRSGSQVSSKRLLIWKR